MTKTARSGPSFRNSDEAITEAVPKVIRERRELGLDGLVGGLEAVVINTEPADLEAAAREFVNTTGYDMHDAFEEPGRNTIVLRRNGSADIVIRSRKRKDNPFLRHNDAPMARHLPNTRLETFVFGVKDIGRYHEVQTSQGVRFMTPDIREGPSQAFIQTIPSEYTGNSLGFVQWKGECGSYRKAESVDMKVRLEKPDRPYLANVGFLDHTATRVKAEDRDAAVLEFMRLTNYDFQFAIYVEKFNSITSVARLSKGDYAQVFTSGITPFAGAYVSGPTERFIQEFGQRVHHLAFCTKDIGSVVPEMERDGMEFLLPLAGSEHDGIRQIFTKHSKRTLLVNEYIERYGDFDGFFTPENVTELTGATGRQFGTPSTARTESGGVVHD